MVTLQGWVSFYCMVICINIFPVFWIFFPFRSIQSTDQSSPSHTVGSHQLSIHILYVVRVCMLIPSSQFIPLPFPLLGVHAFVLCVSISTLQIRSSIPFFQILCICFNILDLIVFIIISHMEAVQSWSSLEAGLPMKNHRADLRRLPKTSTRPRCFMRREESLSVAIHLQDFQGTCLRPRPLPQCSILCRSRFLPQSFQSLAAGSGEKQHPTQIGSFLRLMCSDISKEGKEIILSKKILIKQKMLIKP